MVRDGNFNEFHQFFHVYWSDGTPAWIIKQPFWSGNNQPFDIANEGAVCQVIEEINAMEAFVPKFISYDSLHRILITEYNEDYTSIARAGHSFLMDDLVDVVARMLATTQTHMTQVAQNNTSQTPWCYFKPQPLINNVSYFNPILQNFNHTFVRRSWLADLIVSSDLERVLLSLSQSWQFNNIIHGDPSWTNILVKVLDNNLNVKLCDWEFSGWGDMDWDCACFFQGILDSYLSARISHSNVIRQGERFFKTYNQTLRALNMQEKLDMCFESWFKRVLQLAAIGSLQKVLKLDQEHIGVSDQIIEPKRAIIEFLIKGVVANSCIFKYF